MHDIAHDKRETRICQVTKCWRYGDMRKNSVVSRKHRPTEFFPQRTNEPFLTNINHHKNEWITLIYRAIDENRYCDKKDNASRGIPVLDGNTLQKRSILLRNNRKTSTYNKELSTETILGLPIASSALIKNACASSRSSFVIISL